MDKRTEYISFRLTEQDKEKLKKLADEREWTVSKMVEKIVLLYLKQHEQKC